MSNLALIQPQRVDFDTAMTTDWLDGLPLIATPGVAGTLAGAANIGNGNITVASVLADAALGAHAVSVTGISGGLTYISVTDPAGSVTGQGVVGLPLYAGGITLQLAPGATPFALGDSFAIAVLPMPVDVTGLVFALDARASVGAATIAMAASSADTVPTIINGGATGAVAMRRLKAVQARCLPGDYPYAITATDPAIGLTVPAYYGTIHHVAIPALFGAGA